MTILLLAMNADTPLMKYLFLFSLILVSSCGKEASQKSSSTKQKVSQFYKAKELTVKVYFEPGAEPYIGDGLLFKYWTVLEKNLEALFEGRDSSPKITVPKELNQMQVLPDSQKEIWTIEDVLDLAEKTNKSSHPTQFEVYFLNGRASENPNIIGFHISKSRIIAIFKEVIRQSGSGQKEAVPKYVEQATLVHELGHALGLVNNGVPMKEHHQDKEHGAHCSNPDCVMYYANEGLSDLLTFAQKVSNNFSVIMFDNKCLKDTRSF